MINIGLNHFKEHTYAALSSNGAKNTRTAAPQRITAKKHTRWKLAEKPHNGLAKKVKKNSVQMLNAMIDKNDEQKPKDRSSQRDSDKRCQKERAQQIEERELREVIHKHYQSKDRKTQMKAKYGKSEGGVRG